MSFHEDLEEGEKKSNSSISSTFNILQSESNDKRLQPIIKSSDLSVEGDHIKNLTLSKSLLWENLDQATNIFLLLSGLNQTYRSYKNSFAAAVHASWNCIIIGFSLGSYVFLYINGTLYGDSSVLLDTVVLLRGLSLSIAVYYIGVRLYRPFFLIELPHYAASLKETWLFFIFLLILEIPTNLYLIAASRDSISILALPAEMGQGFLSSACLLWILVDIRVADYLLQECFLCAQCKTLDHQLLSSFREEIQRRSRALQPITLPFIAVAFVSGLYILGALFASNTILTNPAFLQVCGLFLRELIFLLIVLWRAAVFNETAQKLTITLSRSDFYIDEFTRHVKIKELSLFVNIAGEPIAFPIAGITATRRDIAFRGSLAIAGLLTGIAKQNTV